MKSKQYLASEHFWAKKLHAGWRYEFFNELISDTIDNRGRTVPTSDYGIPLIATNCISNDLLYPKFKDIRHISQKTHDEWFRNGHAEPNDIIFVNKGSPGQVCLVPSPVNFSFAQDMIGLKIDNKKIDFRYLLAVLRTKFMQEQIDAFHVGTLIPHLKKADFNSIIIPIPPKKLEVFIGEYYLTISRKIDNLKNQNQILEQIAQTIFKSWFIDFDGQTEFEDSELGKIPKGWKVIDLKNSLSLLKDGSHNPPKRVESGIRFIAGATDVKHFTIDFSKCTFITQKDYEEIHKTWQIQSHDILLTIVGTIGNVAIVNQNDLPFSLQRSLAVLRPNEKIDFIFLYCLLNSNKFEQFLYSNLNPTGQPGIYLGTLGGFQFVLPPKPLIEKFFKLSQTIVSNIQKNYSNMDYLMKIRNSLLPKLMSGEIRV